jgi:hypothetical protein
MKKLAAVAAMALCAWSLPGTTFAAEMQGNWTLSPSREAGQVQFGLYIRNEDTNMQSSSDWPVSAFQGLDLASRDRHDVKFAVVRDAGRFDCDGYLNQGQGAGFFRFTPEAKFVASMRALGFDGIDENKQFAMAVHDVTVEYARQMKAHDLTNLDTDKLLAFRIFNITQQFIRDLRAERLAANDADKLIAFRVHGVTAAMVREVRKAGLEPSEDQLIAMRVHNVTPEFVAQMKARGLTDLSIDKLVALRVHGID